MLHLTLEARIPTPSHGRVPPAPAPTLDRLVVLIRVPTRDRRRIQDEAKGRVVTIVLGQGHMGITGQGQGHPRTEDTIHGQGLQCLEASLPLNGQSLKGKERGSILTDTGKSPPTT